MEKINKLAELLRLSKLTESLYSNAVKITSFLDNTPLVHGYVVIGGFAVSLYIRPRMTDDVDILIELKNISKVNEFFLHIRHELDPNAELIKAGITDPVPYLINMYDKTAQLLIAVTVMQTETIQHRHFHKGVFLPKIEDLVLLKLKAGGSEDLLDVARLLSLPDVDGDYLKTKITEYHLNKPYDKALEFKAGLRQKD